MIWKDYKWNGVDISGKDFGTTFQLMQNVTKDLSVRGFTFNLANNHGGVVWPRIANPRLFTFNMAVANSDEYIRENSLSKIQELFHVSWNINRQESWVLSWSTKDNKRRYCNAMVFTPPTVTNGLCDPIVNVTAELIAQDPRVFDPNTVCVEWLPYMSPGNYLDNLLPNLLWTNDDGIRCENAGDWDAPVRIEVAGRMVNPKIYIYNEWDLVYFLKIEWVTNNLVIDTRNSSSPLSRDRFVVTDNGINISGKIKLEGGGWPLFLGSGTNFVQVYPENFIEAENHPVKVIYEHTYSY